MSVHRYFFWVDETEIEIYKNGVLELYRAEKRTDYSKGIEKFFEMWKDRTSFIDGEDFVDFTFVGKDENRLKKFMEHCESFNFNMENIFTFNDLKKILNEQELKDFCIKVDEKEYFLKKTQLDYKRIQRDSGLEKIYVCGKNVAENLFAINELDLEIDTSKATKGKMASFFEKRIKKD